MNRRSQWAQFSMPAQSRRLNVITLRAPANAIGAVNVLIDLGGHTRRDVRFAPSFRRKLLAPSGTKTPELSITSTLVTRGRGIIHEPDDIRPDNPPSNPELLAFLEQELVAARYDLKHLCRLILNSQTYQLSHIPRSENPNAEANFASYPLRRLEAEVLIDALCQITGTTEHYSSLIPEPYTFISEGRRSIALADASITSPFLEEFGRSPRDTGLEAERISRPTAAQRLHLLNSSHIRQKIEQGPKLQALLRASGKEVVTELYLTILSRFPTEEDLQIVETYTQGGPGSARGKALSDLAWALINSPEFSYRH